MNEQECLSKMVPPSQKRPNKPRGGVIQIWVTRACDKACLNCTQGSNLAGKHYFITPEQFEQAVLSLKDYWGIVGMFGGNPATHPQFEELCSILRKYIPKERCGLWSNNPITPERARAARTTFNPSVSNLNVHLDSKAYAMFKEHWPESNPFGLHQDSRHSPCYVAMKDVLRTYCSNCQGRGCMWDGYTYNKQDQCPVCKGVGSVYDEVKAWELISTCDINQNWSAMVCVVRGQVRAFFCEIAGAQAMLHQDEPNYPDTGLPLRPDGLYQGQYDTYRWWELGMPWFADQVRKHCHDCGVPLRGYGELACNEQGKEQVSQAHLSIYQPKRKDRRVELVVRQEQLGQPLQKMTDYLNNSKR